MTDYAFWNELDTDLERFPARPVIEPHPGMTTRHFRCYRVWFSGLGGYRLFGYLSVPEGDGPFPALLETPRHGSVNNPPHYHDRLRYVMFTMMHRGQRLADVPFAATYPGLYTLGITLKETYIYRAIIADCLRGAEFLLSRPEVDPQRVGVTGEDLALFTAARRPGFRAVSVTTALLHDAMRRRQQSTVYPLEELNDVLRADPGLESALAETLSVFDPVTVAGDVKAEVQLAAPDENSPWSKELLSVLGDRVRLYQRSDEDSRDNYAMDVWLAGRLGLEPSSKFAQHVPWPEDDR